MKVISEPGTLKVEDWENQVSLDYIVRPTQKINPKVFVILNY